MNYTPDITAYMLKEYQAEPNRETVDRLAKELDKSAKSIIGKLSREGVYRRQVYTTKQGAAPVTKLEIVANIAIALGFEADDLLGLDKTPKLVLQKMEKVICISQ